MIMWLEKLLLISHCVMLTMHHVWHLHLFSSPSFSLSLCPASYPLILPCYPSLFLLNSILPTLSLPLHLLPPTYISLHLLTPTSLSLSLSPNPPSPLSPTISFHLSHSFCYTSHPHPSVSHPLLPSASLLTPSLCITSPPLPLGPPFPRSPIPPSPGRHRCTGCTWPCSPVLPITL